MAMAKSKEIKKLRAQKAKYKRLGNLKLVAEYANSIGNLCLEIGEYRQAIDEHETELAICQDLKDPEGEAVACRKLGECYLELVDLEPAKKYVNKYLELAKALPKEIELQRAYVTMGRLLLVEIPTLFAGTTKRKQSERKAENAFIKSLELSDKLKASLKGSEYPEMRAASILNLGLLAELKGENKEAIANLTNAATISRKHGLHDTLVTCLNNKTDLLVRQKEFSEARAVVEEALSLRKSVELSHLVTTVKMLAQVSAEMGDVGVGLDKIKAILRTMKKSPEREELMHVATKLYKIILAKRKLAVSNDEAKCGIFEKIGDYCCDITAYHHALLSYQKTLDILNALKASHDRLAPILVSMARTYQDLKNYAEAMNFFVQEAMIQQQLGNFEQAAKSILNVANCMENNNSSIDMIQQCYNKAESHARKSNNTNLLMLVLKNFRDSMAALDCHEKREDCCRKIEQVAQDFGVSTESQDESQDVGSESSDGGFELSDHSSDEERETEVVTSSRCKPFKISRNEIGETKLHQAVIKGKKETVIELLNKGHPTDVRDHAGWLPIHEAAVHNHVHIAELLVAEGTDINDRAGDQGITPLHDACSSGCTEMIQFLMEAGASVIAKDNENKYSLDCLVEYLQRSYEELTAEQVSELEEVESMIRTAMVRKGITPKCTTFREQLKKQKDDIASEMPVMLPHTKGQDGGKDTSLQEDYLPAPFSPRVSATEMYKSALANVRKSAKRAVLPYTSSRDRDEGDTGPALLPQEGDGNLLSTGDWLVNDYAKSPVEKKPRVSKPFSYKKSEKRKRECSIPSSPSVIDESPQKLSTLIDESSQNLSHVFTNSPAKSDVLSPVSSRPNQLSNHLTNSDGPAVKRFNLASLSSIKDTDYQSSQPLTPAFDSTSEERCKSKRDESANSMTPSALEKLTEILEEPIVFSATKSDSAEADTQPLINSPVNNPSDSKAIATILQEETTKTHIHEDEQRTAEWSDTPMDESLNVSAIHATTTVKNMQSQRKVKGNILAELFSNVDEAEWKNAGGSKPLPTSTPLRKSRLPLHSQENTRPGQSRCATQNIFMPPVANDVSEHRVVRNHAPPPNVKPLHQAFNCSLMTDPNSTIAGSELNSSYHQNIRITVQWKNRVLLIPVPRSESPSIAWLAEEFLRRLSRRRSAQMVPKLSHVFLTRASDGAELFSEDAILDILVDNEKVVLMEEDK